MTKLFRSNRSQAVRLPKAAEFPPDVTDVDVIVEGNSRVLVPKTRMGWEEFFARRSGLSDDFPDDIEDLPPADDVSFDV